MTKIDSNAIPKINTWHGFHKPAISLSEALSLPDREPCVSLAEYSEKIHLLEDRLDLYLQQTQKCNPEKIRVERKESTYRQFILEP